MPSIIARRTIRDVMLSSVSWLQTICGPVTINYRSKVSHRTGLFVAVVSILLYKIDHVYSQQYATQDSDIVINPSGTTVTISAVSTTAISNDGYSSVTLSNAGTLSGTAYKFIGIEFSSSGTSSTATNSGTITASGSIGIGIVDSGTANTVTNSGAINVTSSSGLGIGISGTSSTIINSGSISTIGSGSFSYPGYTFSIYNDAIANVGTITSLNNSGTLTTTGTDSSGIRNIGGTITSLTNSGTISGGGYGIYNDYYSTTAGYIGTLTNSTTGSISSIYNAASIGNINNYGTVTSLTNAETISSTSGPTEYSYYAIALYNDGTFGTITNTGTITGTSSSSAGSGIYNTGIITTLNNSNSISASGNYAWGIYNSGTITALTNTGTISGDAVYENKGIYTDGYIGSLINSGTISATGSAAYSGDFAAGIQADGIIYSFSNLSAGTVSSTNTIGIAYGFWNSSSTINTFVNAGTISGESTSGTAYGFYNSNSYSVVASVSSFTNSGAITGTGTSSSAYGIYNNYYGTISTFTNSLGGTISGLVEGDSSYSDVGNGIYNSGTIGTFINAGSINGTNYNNYNGVGYGIYNYGTISSLTNSGTISGITMNAHTYGIINELVITSLTNSGTISATSTSGNSYGLLNDYGATIETLTNSSSGTIAGIDSSEWEADGIYNDGTITSLTNAGTVSGTSSTGGAYGIYNDSYGIISTFTNSLGGTITGSTAGISYGIYNDGTITALTNNGAISATSSLSYAEGIYNSNTIGVINNSGTITASGLSYSDGIWNDYGGSITSIINSGTISSSSTDGYSTGILNKQGASIGSITATNYGIYNGGTITSLTNGQGGNSASASTTALTYYGALPTNYYEYVTSTTHYGQIAFTSPTGAFTFGIDSGSTLSAGTYSDVLSGITSSNLSNTSGTFGLYSWSLINGGSYYNLVVSSPNGALSSYSTSDDGSISVASGSTATVTSDTTLSTTVKVSGGTLSVSSGSTLTNSQPIQITSTGTATIAGTVNANVAVTGTFVSTSSISTASTSFTVNSGGTVNGNLTLNSGIASIDGTLNGNVNVYSGGALRGSGTIEGGPWYIYTGGILEPGNSPGILYTTTSGIAQSGSITTMDIDGATVGTGGGHYSQINISGSSSTFTINTGAILYPKIRDITDSGGEGVTNTYVPTLGTQYIIVYAEGGVSGTFTTISQPSSGLPTGYRFIDTYTSDEVILSIVPSYSTIGATVSNNMKAVGTVIDDTSSDNSDRAVVLTDLYALTSTSSIGTALQQISGDAHTVSPLAAYRGQQAVMAMVDDRLASLRRDGGTSGTNLTSLDFANISSSEKASILSALTAKFGSNNGSKTSTAGPSLWMRTISQTSLGGNDGNALTLNSSSIGVVLGADYGLGKDKIVGGAASFVRNAATGGSQVLSTGLSFYGTQSLAPFYVSGRIGGSYDEYSNSRSIDFSTISRTASSSTNGYQVTGNIELGRRYDILGYSIEGYSAVNAGSIHRSSFSESGANTLNLTISEYGANTFNTTLGTRISSQYRFAQNLYLTPFAQVAWQHDFATVTGNTTSSLFSTSYTLEGPEIGYESAHIGIGLAGSVGKTGRIFAQYDGSVRTREADHSFELGMAFNW